VVINFSTKLYITHLKPYILCDFINALYIVETADILFKIENKGMVLNANNILLSIDKNYNGDNIVLAAKFVSSIKN